MHRFAGRLSLASLVLVLVSAAVVAGLVTALAISEQNQRGDVKVIVPGVTRDGEVSAPASTESPTEPSASPGATADASATGTSTSAATVPATEAATSSVTAASTPTSPGVQTPAATATQTATPSATPTVSGPAATPTPTPQDLPRVEVTIRDGDGEETVTAQVAATSQQRQVGLMWVTEMPEDEGMLFLFPGDRSGGFWMRNTYIPLDIAYFDSDGILIEVKHGIPLDETSLSPSSPYRYVLEMNAGWFGDHGFGPGSEIILPPGLPEPQ